jgi:methylase of polypeptide subunit release factors
MSTRFDPAKVEPELWRRLGELLRARGLGPAVLRDAERMLPARHDALRLPMVLRLLARQASPAARLARLFVYDDALARSEIEEVLGAELTGSLVARGLVAEAGGTLRSAVRITPFADVLVVSDPLVAPDPVIPPGPTTSELLGCMPPRLDGLSVLDLGCGPGSIAAVLAGRGARVVATDVSERACEYAAATSRLNARELTILPSDGTAAVRERRFDRVLCQPPFVPEPAGETTTYLHGGAHGDELGWRLFRESVPLLAEGGQAIFRLDLAGSPTEVAAQLARDVPTRSFIAFVAPGMPAAELAMAYALAHRASIDASVTDEARRYADAFEAAQITRMSHVIVVGWQGEPGVRVTQPVPSLGALDAARLATARSSCARSLLAGEILARATPSVPRGASLVQRTNLADRAGRVTLEAPGRDPVELSEPVALLVDVLAQGASLEEAADALARRIDRPFEEALEATLGFARSALQSGILEVAPDE